MSKDLIVRSTNAEFLIFEIQDKADGITVRYENETLWMTQKAWLNFFVLNNQQLQNI